MYLCDRNFCQQRTFLQSQILCESHIMITLQLAQLHAPIDDLTKISTFYILWFPIYSLDNMLKVKVTVVRSKAKSSLHLNIAHLHLPTNVLIKYQLSIPYSF